MRFFVHSIYPLKHIVASIPLLMLGSQTVAQKLETVGTDDMVAMHTTVAPVLAEPENNNGGLLLTWYFPDARTSSLKGFVVQKADDKDIFINISDVLSPVRKSFAYKPLDHEGKGYYHFRVMAIKKDGSEIASNPRIFFNQSNVQISAPRNLTAQLAIKGDKRVIDLQWDAPPAQADEVKAYQLYSSSPDQYSVVKDASVRPTTATRYVVPVYSSKAANYSFAVSAINREDEESPLSTKVTIEVPSEILPFINIWPVEKEDQVVKLHWKYPEDITDLSGFRLYQNKELIANEKVLDAHSRQWVSVPLDPGVYNYEIMAVSFSNIQSEISQARKFEIK